MIDIAPFPQIIVTHDKFNLHYGKNINLVQLERARFVIPSRGAENRVKTKNRKANIRPCGTHHVLPLCLLHRHYALYISPCQSLLCLIFSAQGSSTAFTPTKNFPLGTIQ
jgi:hypothetical protein